MERFPRWSVGTRKLNGDRMTLLKTARQWITNVVIELPARASGMDRLIGQLEKSGQAIARRAASAGAGPAITRCSPT